MLPFRPAPAPQADRATSLSADDLRSPEEIAERRRRRRWLIMLPILLALAVGAWFAARPASHVVKAWQARRAAAEAENLVREHKWFAARTKVQDALALWRQEPAALRAAALFLAATGNSQEAADFWKQVKAARPLTADEQRDYAQSLMAADELDQAETHLREAWPSAQPGTPADWDLGMKLAVRRNRAAEASALARRLLASHAATRRERLDGALTLLSTEDAGAQGAAWAEIQALAQDRASAESLDALLLLARRAAASSSPNHPPASPNAFPTLAELTARIEAHPLTKIQHRLLLIDLQIASDPARRAAWIQTARDRFADTRDDADLATLGAWLYSKGEYPLVLQAIPAARAFGDHALFFQRLDALGALGRWSEIQDAILSNKIALDPMIAQMYLARCAGKLNEPRVRDARWDAALDAAGADPKKLVQLGQYAEKNGAADVAGKAFRAAVQAAPKSPEAYGALIGLLEARSDTASLRQTLATMVGIWPQDNAIRNDLAYFDALTDQNVPAALATARALVRAEPASLPHRTTLALAELRSGDALGALDAFGGVSMKGVAMQPRQRAVYAAVLWATSYNRAAREEFSGIALQNLLPEERALLQPIQDATPGP